MSAEKDSNTHPKTPFYIEVDGWRLPGIFSPDVFRSALAYKPRSDDVFIVSFPKCGTTWMQGIVACIFRDGKPFEGALDIFAPFLEMTGAEGVEKLKRPAAIKIHLPFHKAPWSPEAKYIFVARNPKDCVVSFYHFAESTPVYRFENGKFDDYFELFMNGKTDFGEYFDTTLSWYERRNEPNVLFLVYEHMKKDTENHVLKIAEFLGAHYREKLEKDEKILKDVIKHSSFSYMKEHMSRHFLELKDISREQIEQNLDLPSELRTMILSGELKLMKDEAKESPFVRKGEIGDWRNHLSPSQNERLEKKFREKFAGTGLLNLWKDVM